MKKFLENFTESNIDFDDPHVELRCKENNFTKQDLIRILLYETNKLSNVIADRSKVYKLYFNLSNRRQLKVIIDLFEYKKIKIRTIKILDRKLYKRIRLIKRKR
ncbi:hypothetical protein HYT56_03040 [Candidatus Woesearchaeota archaeon]|nr:hypothetical protein [Candidatus Woesearchaeota archaeon]